MARIVTLAALGAAATLASAHANLVQNGGFEAITGPAQTRGFELGPNFAPPATLDNWTSANAPGARAFNIWVPSIGAAVAPPPNDPITEFTTSERQNLAVPFAPTGAPGAGAGYTQADVLARGLGAIAIGASPVGGAFVALDGDTAFNGPLSQTVTGLVPGAQYLLSFFWAAGMFDNRVQQTYDAGLSITNSLGITFGTETANTGNVVTVPAEFTPWALFSRVFTASSATQTLSFLSVGAPNGLPPVALLDGVSLTAVPVPASALLFGIALAGLGAAVNGRRHPAPVTSA